MRIDPIEWIMLSICIGCVIGKYYSTGHIVDIKLNWDWGMAYSSGYLACYAQNKKR